ncbi:MAG: TIGR02206 family membrane protein, partial [Flavobacteriales bacterium]|nr:TIGR02206 family membrane protein [Flavobacteriales bacterium]
LSSFWWVGLLSSLAFIIVSISVFYNSNKSVQLNFTKYLSVAFIITYLISNVIAINNGLWNLKDNLPFHLCRISFILSVIVLIYRSQWVYEWLLLLAIPSGIHSLLTPEMTIGVSNWFYFDYYFVHAGLILVPLYLTVVLKLRPRTGSWWKTILRLQIPVIIILPLNFLLDSNYMYLKEKPLVNNPFLIGEWPFYILFLEIVMIIHVLVVYKLTPKQ